MNKLTGLLAVSISLLILLTGFRAIREGNTVLLCQATVVLLIAGGAGLAVIQSRYGVGR